MIESDYLCHLQKNNINLLNSKIETVKYLIDTNYDKCLYFLLTHVPEDIKSLSEDDECKIIAIIDLVSIYNPTFLSPFIHTSKIVNQLFKDNIYRFFYNAIEVFNLDALNFIIASDTELNFWDCSEYMDITHFLSNTIFSKKQSKETITTFVQLLYNTKLTYTNYNKLFNHLKYDEQYYDLLLNIYNVNKDKSSFQLTNYLLSGITLLDYDYELIFTLEILYTHLDTNFLYYYLNHTNITSLDFYCICFEIMTEWSNSLYEFFNDSFTKEKYNLYYIKFTSILFSHAEKLFKTHLDVTKLINSINFNILVCKDTFYPLFVSMSKYVDSDIYNSCDDSGYSILLDCAKYGNFNLFKFIFERTNTKYWYSYGNCNNKSSENILVLSIYNKDTRLFNYILESVGTHDLEKMEYDLSYTFAYIFNKMMYISTTKLMRKIDYYYTFRNNAQFITEIALKSNSVTIFNSLYKKYKFSIGNNDITTNHANLFNDKEALEIIYSKLIIHPDTIINKDMSNFLYHNLINNCLNSYHNTFIINYAFNKINYRLLLETYIINNTNNTKKICNHCKDLDYCYKSNLNFFYNKLKLMNPKPIIRIYHLPNKQLIRIIFITGIYQFLTLYKLYNFENKYYNTWLRTINFLKKVIQKKKKYYKKIHSFKQHSINNDIILNPIHIKPVHKYIGKQSYLVNSNKPKHINLTHFMNLLDEDSIFITEKADGISDNIGITDLYPTITTIKPIINLNSTLILNCEKVSIKNTTIYFIFGTIEFIHYLRSIHPYTKTLKCDSSFNINSEHFDMYKSNETLALMNFICDHSENENTNEYKLWWPKMVWTISSSELLNNYSYIKTLENNIFPTDGWVINSKTNLLKLKPNHKLTIDLLYKANTKEFVDYEGNCYQNTVLSKHISCINVDTIFRCYYAPSNYIWEAKEIRTDKQYPNYYTIIEEIGHYLKYPWEPEDIKTYMNPNYYHFKQLNSKLHLKTSNRIHKKEFKRLIKKYINLQDTSLLNIGCGYTFKPSNFKPITFKNYIGIDSDYTIIKLLQTSFQTPSKKYHLLDFSKDWDTQLNKFYPPIELGTFNYILCLNTIHNAYLQFDYFCKKITSVSNTNCTLIIKFLNRHSLDKLFRYQKRIIHEQSWISYESPNQIKYYYFHCHKTPIVEYTFTDSDIKNEFIKNGWELIDHVIPTYTATLWDIYLTCFETLIFTKL